MLSQDVCPMLFKMRAVLKGKYNLAYKAQRAGTKGAERRSQPRNSKVLFVRTPWIMLSALLLGSLLYDGIHLVKYQAAVGLDGYYYALQIRQLLQHHALYFPARDPFVFYLMAGVSRLIHDPIAASKYTAISLDAVLIVGMFFLVAIITESAWLGLLAGLLSISSALHFYFVGEYIKNLATLAFLMWLTISVIAYRRSKRKLYIFISGLLAFAALFSHISALFLLVFAGIFFLALRFLTEGWSKALIIGTLGLLWFAPVLLLWQPIIQIPQLLNREFLPSGSFPIQTVGWSDKTILFLVAPFMLALLVGYRKELGRSPLLYVGGVAAIWTVLITLNPFLNHNRGSAQITGRLDELSYLQVAILIPCLLKIGLIARTKILTLFSAALLPLLLVAALAPLPRGLQPEYLQERTVLVKSLSAKHNMIEKNAVVLAPHGDEFLITYMTGAESTHVWSNTDLPSHALWLLRVQPDTLTPSMMVLTTGTSEDIALIRDGDLRREILVLSPTARAHLVSWNPPVYVALHGVTDPNERDRIVNSW
ncbi:MAG TPA: hypothetical protein VJN90_03425 [Candidatus Acidoferrales bacterium]|nr:hypothetical protein [Candidatus Acidoferrales bacterium]